MLTPCWLVVRYRSHNEKYLHAICTSKESAECRSAAVQIWCDNGDVGCRVDDKVSVEESQLDHLFGEAHRFT